MAEEGIKELNEQAIRTGLCVECGACAAVCPTQAITLKEYEWGTNPELTGRCPEEVCDLCYRVCPAAEVPSAEIEKTFLGRRRDDTFPENAAGVVRNVCSAHSTVPEIRRRAYAGGVLTSVLLSALEHEEIDAAVVAGFDSERPWRVESRIARTREEIIESAGSKYQPHPQILGLKQAIDEGFTKIAVTAAPCHVEAVRKMQLCDALPYREHVRLVIGFVCATHWTVQATEHLITRVAKIPLEDVASLAYRARPFPGLFRVITKDGRIFEQDFVMQLLHRMFRFVPEHCRLCPEKTAMFPDITLGDVWGHPVYDPSRLAIPGAHTSPFVTDERYREAALEAVHGMSAVITKSEEGERIFQQAVEAGYVRVFPESKEQCYPVNQTLQRWESTLPILEAREHRGMPYRRYHINFFEHFKRIAQAQRSEGYRWPKTSR